MKLTLCNLFWPSACRRTLTHDALSVKGEMQCKFAALAPIEMNGVLLGDRLVATWWRSYPPEMGSGTLDLRVTSDATRLDGEGTWYTSSSAPPEHHTLHWERAVFTNPYDSPQEQAAQRTSGAWKYLYDPLVDRWVLKTLFAIAVVGAMLSGLSTACLSR